MDAELKAGDLLRIGDDLWVYPVIEVTEVNGMVAYRLGEPINDAVAIKPAAQMG